MKHALFMLACVACASDPPPTSQVTIAPPTTSASTPVGATATPDAAVASMFGQGGLGSSEGEGALRPGGAQVHGRLPPEVIQRIFRQHLGQMKLCYEKELHKDPTLKGRVVTRFVIDTSGNVSKAERHPNTDLPNAEVVACVVDVFKRLTFPQPEGGEVNVVYPLIFSPGGD